MEKKFFSFLGGRSFRSIESYCWEKIPRKKNRMSKKVASQILKNSIGFLRRTQKKGVRNWKWHSISENKWIGNKINDNGICCPDNIHTHSYKFFLFRIYFQLLCYNKKFSKKIKLLPQLPVFHPTIHTPVRFLGPRSWRFRRCSCCPLQFSDAPAAPTLWFVRFLSELLLLLCELD